jgi:hypothetical protein
LQEWQHSYNWFCPLGSLGGRTPMDKYFQVSKKAPFWDEVSANYDDSKGERVQDQNCRNEFLVERLKRSM